METIPKSTMQTFSSALVAILITSMAASAAFYTNETGFLNAITGGNYTETFDSIPVDQTITAPTNFSGSGFSFAATTGTGNPLYGLGTAAPDRWLTTFDEGNPLVFTNFTNATAFGGYFFNTDNNGNIKPANLFLEAVGDGITNTQMFTVSTNTDFFGWTFGAGIASVTITSTNYYPTASSVTLGTTVPEPSTSALILLSSGALAASAAARRRRRADR